MDIGWITRQSQGQSRVFSGDRPAVSLESGETWTYDSLHRISNQYAHVLQDMGIGRGDRIGILMHNSAEYLAMYLAVAKLGAIAVRINFRLLPEELSYILHDAQPRILCLDDSTLAGVKALAQDLPIEKVLVLTANPEGLPDWSESWDVLQAGHPGDIAGPLPAESDPAMLMYTSGTTGRPKGAMWTHGNLLWFAAMQVMRWRLNENTVALMSGPMYHVGAIEDVGLATLMAGGHVVIMRSGQFNVRRALSMVAEHHVTDAILFPFMIYDLLQLPGISSTDMGSVRHIYSGGDPVLPWAIEELMRRFPHICLTQVYGLTEGTPIITSLDLCNSTEHADSVGTPLPLAEVRVAGDSGEDLGRNATGEIWTRSPAVVKEYWQNRTATQETFTDGWCRTGDLGRIDDGGYLKVVGRKKDMIRSGGENIYPAEVEDVLIRHPAIQEVAVIGLPDPTYIETVCAIIVLQPSAHLSREEVIAYCREHLAGFKKPRQVAFVSELPRTASGKVLKHLLREQWNPNPE